jgi:hypothetical protein
MERVKMVLTHITAVIYYSRIVLASSTSMHSSVLCMMLV